MMPDPDPRFVEEPPPNVQHMTFRDHYRRGFVRHGGRVLTTRTAVALVLAGVVTGLLLGAAVARVVGL